MDDENGNDNSNGNRYGNGNSSGNGNWNISTTMLMTLVQVCKQFLSAFPVCTLLSTLCFPLFVLPRSEMQCAAKYKAESKSEHYNDRKWNKAEMTFSVCTLFYTLCFHLFVLPWSEALRCTAKYKAKSEIDLYIINYNDRKWDKAEIKFPVCTFLSTRFPLFVLLLTTAVWCSKIPHGCLFKL